MKPLTVTIMYGIGEGRWHGRHFRKALKRAGYKVIKKAEDADVIISHSGGCFFLPKTRPEQIIVLINPPYWPGKPLALSAFQKVWWDFKAFYRRGKVLGFLLKTAWNTAHLVRYIGISLTISLKARRHNFYQAIRQDVVIIIRNHDDAWCSPDIDTQLRPHREFIMHRLPGQHDDCWANPGPYVTMIQSDVTALLKERGSL